MLTSRRAASGVKFDREVGDDQDAVRLGHLAGLRVVLLDRLELVAQVLLDHVLHVLGQVGQPLLDVLRLGPDAAGDELLVVVGQVHEARRSSRRGRPGR